MNGRMGGARQPPWLLGHTRRSKLKTTKEACVKTTKEARVILRFFKKQTLHVKAQVVQLVFASLSNRFRGRCRARGGRDCGRGRGCG